MGVITDRGVMLVGTVVVGNDSPGANVHSGADRRISYIRQMIGFSAYCQGRIFDFDEVANVHLGGQGGARAQASEGTDD